MTKIKPVFNFEDIQEHIDALANNDYERNNLFLIRNANQWIDQAKKRPVPMMLFDKFWHEGELCICYADTNLGKTILAVQIADSITNGTPIRGFKLEAARQPVLYFDFELSDKQFEARYSVNYSQHYTFDTGFLRAEINPDAPVPDMFKSFEDYINHSIEQAIITTGAKVVIIDNITYLKDETEKARTALPLMKHLQSLKKRYGLSILVLAHTPKRDLSKPITRNDLQGSKMLINFCDSAFAIGESHADKNIRYLKQIKVRNTEHTYDSENVCVCQVVKPFNFLHFDFLTFGSEREHLRQQTEDEKSDLISKVKELTGQGKSQRQIAGELGISLGAVNKYVHSVHDVHDRERMNTMNTMNAWTP